MSDRFDIERRAAEMFANYRGGSVVTQWAISRAIQLARETAEAIAKNADACAAICEIGDYGQGLAEGYRRGANIARYCARPPEPETREKRLERALEEIAELHEGLACRLRARKALEEP